MAKLNIIDGPDVGSEYDLDEKSRGERFTLGRDPRVEIPLNDPAVSREHVRIENTERGWRVVDLGSRNQTFLNGEVVRESVLASGDLVRIGDTEIKFENIGESLAEETPGSTIVKSLPSATHRETFLVRLDNLERMLQEEKARRTLDDVRKLFEVQTSMAGTATAEELFRRVLDEVIPALQSDSAAILMREGGEWRVRASAPSEGFDQTSFSRSVVDRADATGKPLLVENPQSDDELRDKPSIIGKEISTVLAIPFPVADGVKAVVYADRRGSATSFLDADLEMLTATLEPIGSLLRRLLEEERLRRENRNLFRSLTETKKIIGKSPAVQKVHDFIGRAAPTPMTVLIQGETGTGKELVASAIHYASPRHGKPFVALNCAALPENLVESELFGHEKGAFTGAVNRRKGRFEMANGGTIFLDEIGELSAACQGKLLRLLEERKFERVGGTDAISVDVRVVAATNRNLLEEVEEGKFREDLYYRLSVLNVALPPLRERQEDIPLLVEFFLKDCHSNAKRLTKQAQKKLIEYSWPGNVRQLRNVVESALVLGDAEEIQPDDLLLPEKRLKKDAHDDSTWEPISLQNLEKIHIGRVLEHTGGNKKRAAEILGIERCTLYAKLKTYKI